MQESPTVAPGRVVPVVRPIAIRQLAAGLATVAAAAAASGLALRLTTVERGPSEFGPATTVSRFAWGEQTTGIDGEFSYESVTWGGPLLLAVLLLTGASASAVLAARTENPEGWARLAQRLAVAGAAVVAGILTVLVMFGLVDAETDNYDVTTRSVATEWGPLPGVLLLALALAAAAAATVRRGRATVLATVEVRS